MPQSYDSEGFEIAVIGMAGRFPGAGSVEKYWNNILSGTESVAMFTAEELAGRGVSNGRLSRPNFVPAAATVPDADLFAASFFGYSPREAELMDPQHRLFLECVWEAIETAGYPPRSLNVPTGVFAGASLSTYMLFNLMPANGSDDSADEFQVMIGSDKDFLSTRVSFKLNLKGPSITVQSGCSTSLVAVHLAVQNLLAYQCDLAIAGGASIGVPQRTGYRYEQNGILSPDGHTRTFDAQAAGTLFGEGVGVVVLKRLADAVRDGDSIDALILGSAINNDGASKLGFTAPSVEGQADAIARALAVAGVSADTLGYIEAHGTATALGDPVEIAALTKAFRQTTDRRNFCGVGSVKSNIGHLDAAAGVAGLIKAVLMLKHRCLPPTLHFHSPNPRIDFENSPFYVISKQQEWKSGQTRRAGVSSFGIGGTNAHVVLQEAPERPAGQAEDDWRILSLSAQTTSALDQATARLGSFLENAPDVQLADVAYTLHVGREHFGCRRSLVARDSVEAASILASRDPEHIFSGASKLDLKVGFMFPGGGTQYPRMGAELYDCEPEFRKHVDACMDLLPCGLAEEIRAQLYPKSCAVETADAKLVRTSIGLPATFITEFSLARLLMSWGIHPECMIGHSLGEYAAACLAGVFSLEDALSLVAYRGRMFETLPSGSMVTVCLSEREAQFFVQDGVSIAAVNCPDQCVLSGRSQAIEEVCRKLSECEIEFHRLHICAAAHSSLVEPAMEEFRRFLMRVEFHSPALPFVSNLSGDWITAEQTCSRQYWVDHLRGAVRFADGIAALLARPDLLLLEVGPSTNLTTLVRRQFRDRSAFVHACMRHPQDRSSERETILRTVAKIWNQGVEIDWNAWYGQALRRRIPLPTYPFERERYWVDPEPAARYLETVSIPAVYSQNAMPADLVSVRTEGTRQVRQAWILFPDAFGIGDALRQILLAQGEVVITHGSGEQGAHENHGNCAPGHNYETEFNQVLHRLSSLAPERMNVIHCSSIAHSGLERPFSGASAGLVQAAVFGLIRFMRAMAALPDRPPMHLLAVTSGTAEVSGADAFIPENSAFAGCCRVFPYEYENVSSRVVDVLLESTGAHTVRRIARQIHAEMLAGGGPAVAYRGNRRYALRFEPAVCAPELGAPLALREGGVYLITGGLGELGPVLAQSFAQRIRCKLILSGRSAFPESKEWEAWLQSHRTEHRTTRAIRRLQKAETLGSEIMIRTADVTDSLAMRSLIGEIERCFGVLHGVVHLAGVTGNRALCLMSDIEEEEYLKQALPKMAGAHALAGVLGRRALDFCVLFSSTASVLGGAGMAAYASANAFLDGFAKQHCLVSGQRWISIGWDAWLAGDALAYAGSAKTALDRFAISVEEATETLHRILATAGGGHYIVSTGELQPRIQEAMTGQKSRVSDNGVGQGHSRPALVSDYVAPSTELQRQIAEVWAEVLRVDKIGMTDNFFDLGGNSLIGLRIISKLKRKLGIDIPALALFEGPTILGFSRLLAPEPSSASTYAASRARGEKRRKKRLGCANEAN